MKKDYTLITILTLIFFFPAGLYFMWKKTEWKKPIKVIISVMIGLMVIGAFSMPDTQTPEKVEKNVTETKKEKTTKEEKAKEEKPKLTVNQTQAVKKAESYLNVSGFSRLGLIDQLVFEGFSNEDATFAVDYIKVDWKEQASKKAKEYLDVSSFSRQGLIDQLVFEKFTLEEATYGVDTTGLK